jgi:hypothetical protein
MKYSKSTIFMAVLVSIFIVDNNAFSQNVNVQVNSLDSVNVVSRMRQRTGMPREDIKVSQQGPINGNRDERYIEPDRRMDRHDYYYDDRYYDGHGQEIIVKRPMRDENFMILCSLIDKQPFEDDKIEMLQAGVLENYFTCQQCSIIVQKMSFQSGRKNVIVTMRDHIIDLWNIDVIFNALTFLSERDDVYQIFGVDKRQFR